MEQILWKNSRALFHLNGESRRTEILRSAQDDNPTSVSFDSQRVLFEMDWARGPHAGSIEDITPGGGSHTLLAFLQR